MVIHSPIPSVSIPTADVVTFFFQQAQQLPANVPILVDGQTDQSLTFSDIKQYSESIASYLTSILDDKGGTVAVCGPPDIMFCPIFYGTLMAGGVYTAFSQVDKQRLDSVNPQLVITTPEYLSQVKTVYQGRVILMEDICRKTQPSGFTPKKITSEKEQEETVAHIVFTSGTTDRAKGIQLTHRNIVAMYCMVGGYSARTVHSQQTQSHVLSALPLWHIYGHSVLCYQPLTTGDCVVQLPGYETTEYLKTLEKYRIGRLAATPSILHDLFTRSTQLTNGRVVVDEKEYSVKTVKAVGCGGAMLPQCRAREYSSLFNGSPVIVGYGATESTSIIAGCSWQKPAPGATGILYPNSFAKVVDSDGNETSEFGELCVGGPHVMKGYVGKVESPVEDGFLYTGDYARVSEDGQVYLKGRIKDLVKIDGRLVSPTDLENRLFEHPLIKDCAVAGQRAYVVLESTDDGGLKEIEEWCSENTGVTLKCFPVEKIPKSPAGKVLRNELSMEYIKI